MSRTFESSAAGRLNDDAVLECGVCWWVFDPATGDAEADILPGTAFSSLQEGFRCPSCDAPKSKFMVRQPGAAAAAAPRPLPDMAARVASLVAAYERAEDAMVGLPVHNPSLRIEAVGFRPVGEGYAGIIVTPWCMNLALVPEDPEAAPPGPLGSKRDIVFPAGGFSFIAGRMDGFGVVETCSLFSPMDMFDDPDVAKETARSAVEALFEADEPAAPSRRNLFVGGGAAS